MTDAQIVARLRDIMAAHYRGDPHMQYAGDLAGALYELIPEEEEMTAECVNCGAVGGHTEVCVHHPDVQARLRS